MGGVDGHSPLVGTVLLFATIVCIFASERAPMFSYSDFKPEIPYKVNEALTLQCQADGNPSPEYEWRKNGVPLDVSDATRYKMQPGSGNLIILRPNDLDDGDYNCLASNKLGRSVGMKMRVQKAVVDSFPTVPVQTKEIPVGESLTIKCNPPYSYPKGSSYFGVNRETNKLEPIANDDRVLLDYDGNLHFANVWMNDSLTYLGDKVNYVCVVYNNLLGAYVQGNDHKLTPISTASGSPSYRAPQLMWPLYSSTVAILGQGKSLKCIFSGLPTPKVTWQGASSNFEVTKDGYGTEIKFTSVRLQDDGDYTCTASNSERGPRVWHRIRLIVQSLPKKKKVPTATLR